MVFGISFVALCLLERQFIVCPCVFTVCPCVFTVCPCIFYKPTIPQYKQTLDAHGTTERTPDRNANARFESIMVTCAHHRNCR